VVECAGLEIRYTVLPYRGFESLLLRQGRSPEKATEAISTHKKGLEKSRPFVVLRPGTTCCLPRLLCPNGVRVAQPHMEPPTGDGVIFTQICPELFR
jgi:hypothetical protein